MAPAFQFEHVGINGNSNGLLHYFSWFCMKSVVIIRAEWTLADSGVTTGLIYQPKPASTPEPSAASTAAEPVSRRFQLPARAGCRAWWTHPQLAAAPAAAAAGAGPGIERGAGSHQPPGTCCRSSSRARACSSTSARQSSCWLASTSSGPAPSSPDATCRWHP